MANLIRKLKSSTNLFASKISLNDHSGGNKRQQGDVDDGIVKCVEICMDFLKVGRVDTKTECFEATLLVESSWEDQSILNSIREASESHREIENVVRAASGFNFNPKVHWTPRLFITNAIGELKEDCSYNIEIFCNDSDTLEKLHDQEDIKNHVDEIVNNLTVRVIEMRKVKGTFYQRLDLHDFPVDLQELSISISTHCNFGRIIFRESPVKKSTINVNEFVDVQQWKLLSHLRLTSKLESDHFYATDKPFFIATMFASRRPLYFMFNVYLVLFVMSCMFFVTFSFDARRPQFRSIVCSTLLIAPVNFRWVTTQLLPSVRYLTRLDKHGVGSLLISICILLWHGLIGSDLITSDENVKIMYDKNALMVFGLTSILFNTFSIGKFIYLFIRRQRNEFRIESIEMSRRESIVKMLKRERRDSGRLRLTRLFDQ